MLYFGSVSLLVSALLLILSTIVKRPDPRLNLRDRSRKVGQLTGHKGYVYSVAFAPDGRRALSAGQDHSVRLWDLTTGEEIRRLEGNRDQVWCVAFSRDGRLALSAGLAVLAMWTGLTVSYVFPATPPSFAVVAVATAVYAAAAGRGTVRRAFTQRGQRTISGLADLRSQRAE